jgi:bifunctional DNA-binding transcriptional regulator/antitoxin component of YhaV-PrlF toxin-antitoxin module
MTPHEMEERTQGVDVKAEKIRILFDAGAERGDIARFLNISYQHVHNVLKRSNRLGRPQGEPGGVGTVFQVKVERGGRIVLPREYVEAQRISEGDLLICRDDGGNLVIMSRAAAIETVREIARRRMPEEAALIEALLSQPPPNS